MNYNQASNVAPTQDVLLQKLNYMISLLEDQQDEKTNNVTEEVVLYSFLGIFIIFIVDSFAKVGKYVR
jgi:high-affinity K+ transport system ATPase subunit B